MPPDIRNFFGGGSQKASTAAKKASDNPAPKKKRGRKVVDDSDDEEITETKPKKAELEKAKTRKEKPQPKVEETTSSEYFASNSKAKTSKSTPIRAKPHENKTTRNVDTTPSKPRATNGSTPSSRRSTRNIPARKYADNETDDKVRVLDDDEEGNDDIHADEFARKIRNGRDDYEESDESHGSPIRHKARTANRTQKQAKAPTKPKPEADAEMSDTAGYDAPGEAKSAGKKLTAPSAAGRKRKSKSAELEEDDFLEEDEVPKKRARKTPTKSTAKKATKKEEKEESKEMQAIFDSIPTVRAPTPPARDPNNKYQYNANQHHAPPPGAGSKVPPTGAENCLAGLTFVFTGVLDTLEREEGQALVKRHGGKVTTGPSSKTSYVVLGNDAGPKKLETIAKLKLKTINEDGLFELIRRLPPNGGDSKAAEKHAEKKEKEEKAIREAAAEMERTDREAAKAKAAMKVGQDGHRVPSSASSQQRKAPAADSRLWTDKYAPTAVSMVCGNKGQVEKLQNWLRKWHNNAKYHFKKAGPDGSGVFRAAMIHGPPGIGKTTAAHLVAKLEGFDIVESNASDTRSKKLVEDGLRGVLDTTSLLGYFSGDGKKVEASKRKLVLIMDEVDGMSAGDRGGVGALAAVAKKTSVPMILICNERRLPKMKPFDFVTWDVPFRRPTADMIRARLKTICYREGMDLPASVLDALIEGSHSDIRQIINMISTTKLDRQTMDFDDGKAMSKAWEKHVILKPWDIVGKILKSQMFAPSSTATLNDKIELYFNDHEFSYLMLQENYLKTQPARVNNYSGRERNLKLLEFADKAASSISDGDLVDRMIHGTQQQWSLMPTHAVFSFVRPASYMYGNFGERVGFVSWLGQNSKFGKLSRYVKEMQGHMRLRASGDRHEIRQQYMPLLWQKTVKVLQDQGKEKVPEVIDLMDSYFLTKEDYDAMIELGLGPMSEDNVKIDSQAKATFTRMYNAQSHPLPFMKASSVVAPKAAKKVKPDLEDAIDESDGGEELLEENEVKEDDEEDVDLKKDKYIKAPKKKPAAKGAAKSAPKGKKRGKKAADEGDDEVDDSASEEEVKKPKKGAARGGRKGKGKGKA
ncbi:hypothetical protein EPUS_08019 [Endocarpon pusillum Z07020]|uniref:Replication factor C subunit 1 n=1 Tax=Endocarpon pusillum (strain Z07020 / HMAS-L-300199) TaxID=1263415 RepID=U1GCN7_ENDPU|nr:uncharacterized protein EPUS_08019 [Endocarpon pusillum Z07020]ERF69818.1 hypothetical protein EPUS_08019 [Endocarpon pusillum Z07020]